MKSNSDTKRLLDLDITDDFTLVKSLERVNTLYYSTIFYTFIIKSSKTSCFSKS